MKPLRVAGLGQQLLAFATSVFSSGSFASAGLNFEGSGPLAPVA